MTETYEGVPIRRLPPDGEGIGRPMRIKSDVRYHPLTPGQLQGRALEIREQVALRQAYHDEYLGQSRAEMVRHVRAWLCRMRAGAQRGGHIDIAKHYGQCLSLLGVVVQFGEGGLSPKQAAWLGRIYDSYHKWYQVHKT